MTNNRDHDRYVEAIRDNDLSIYDPVEPGDPLFWIPAPELEELLRDSLEGVSVAGLPLRTRSKVVKEQVCRALGYKVPSSFKKTQPRFPGQQFDTYVQKSLNLQIWNEELSPTRRYVIIKINERDCISSVRVINGEALAKLDTTGTLTQKYQASLVLGQTATELVTQADTPRLQKHVRENLKIAKSDKPTDAPRSGQLIAIHDLFSRLSSIIGRTFPNEGADQERNRGAVVHRIACEVLGYSAYSDSGQFPDIRHQLLEIKLQTSPTIDLGLVCPDSEAALDTPRLKGDQIRHCDVRYAIFYGQISGADITITHFLLTSGQAFFSRFSQFKGKVLNKKLQIPLPKGFFR